MQKKIKWGLILALLSLVLAGSIACNPFGSSEQETGQQLVEVVRGDLTVTISGSGNTEFSNEMKLTFGIGGRIDKIYVKEGDEVSKGEVLAKLKTDALELALAQAQVAVTQAQVAVTQAQVAVTQAQISLQTAELELDITRDLYTLSDIRVAQADVDVRKRDLEEALFMLYKYDPGTPGFEAYQKILLEVQARLNTAEDRLEAMLSGSDPKEVAIKKRQVEAAQQSLGLAQQSPELAQQSLELAKKSLELAKKQLDEATITAPFDGVVASVGVDEKDTVTTATTIIHLIDPSSMELKVEVDEIDIPEVKPGQRAIIEVDALPAFPIEGKVHFISLLPTAAGGVIVYDVDIAFAVPEGSGLRAGMSATADIITAERNNVLLVPDRAIKQDSKGNPIVEVMANEQIEERAVVTGVSDSFQTEIVEGLQEGEIVVERRAKPKPSG